MRAVDDPVALARAARIFRAALARAHPVDPKQARIDQLLAEEQALEAR